MRIDGYTCDATGCDASVAYGLAADDGWQIAVSDWHFDFCPNHVTLARAYRGDRKPVDSGSADAD